MDYHKLLETLLREKEGMLLTKDIIEAGISKQLLSKYVKKGYIERVAQGVYLSKDAFEDEMYVLQARSKKAIFSHETALYLHDLSDRNPSIYDITIPYGYGNSYKDEKNVNLHYVKKELLDLGVTEMTSPFGMKVRVYDVERTICDIVKNKNRMDSEIFTRALQRYSKLKSKDLNKLMRYAKQLKVDKKVREYMEVLI